MADGRIFISYRRKLDQGTTGRLYDRLERHYDRSQLFMDVDDIPLGVDFAEHLAEQVEKCDVFLVVIGQGWLESKDRLQDEGDFVRLEIEAALQREKIPVIPVMVDGASMPKSSDLPESLHPLCRRNAINLRHDSFRADVDDRLRKSLDQSLKSSESSASRSEDNTELKLKKYKNAIWFLVVVIAVVVLAINLPPLIRTIFDSGGPMVLTSNENAARTPFSEIKPGDSFWDCRDCPEMVVIPEGAFTMGSRRTEKGHKENEGPQYRVLMQSYALGRTEVTFDQWLACVDDGGCVSNTWPSDSGGVRGNRPVIDVSWTDAREYVAWLNSKLDGKPYRLPSESEWEYAARAGTSTAYSTGDTITPAQANFGTTFEGGTSPVSTFGANPWGLYDMHGNVFEWCEDDWVEGYQTSRSQAAFLLSPRGDYRVVRGGSWGNSRQALRSAHRVGYQPDSRGNLIGFRLARTLPTR